MVMDLRVLLVLILFQCVTSADNILGRPNEAICKNKVDDARCHFWKRHQACRFLPKRMFKLCKRACHFCAGMCEDKLFVKCRWLVTHGACYSHKERMKKMCPRSCEFCIQRSWTAAARSPSKCSRAKYGCCWDRLTTAAGPNQEGCPTCRDKRLNICRHFKPDCYSGSRNLKFMHRNCAETCGVCQTEFNFNSDEYASFEDEYRIK